VDATADGGYIFTSSYLDNSAGDNFWIVKLSGSGDIQWQKT
jgi:hypothetical protein